MQRFLPPEHEVLRCSWRKDIGYKVHRLSQEKTEDAIRAEPFAIDMENAISEANISQELLQRNNGHINMKQVTSIYNRI